METKSVNGKISRRDSFKDVLNDCDNQVIVRELLVQYVPLHVQEKIIDEFNKYADRRNGIPDK